MRFLSAECEKGGGGVEDFEKVAFSQMGAFTFISPRYLCKIQFTILLVEKIVMRRRK